MSLDFAAGCLGGAAGILFGYPLDTVKVMMQTQNLHTCSTRSQYTGTYHCIRSIIRKESISGLYRGLSSPLCGVALVNAIVFGIYGNVQKMSSDPNSLYTHLKAGTLAGLAQSIITSPMELAKTRLQLQSTSNNNSSIIYSGAFDCARHIYRMEGIRGLYRGFGITIARDVPGFACYFLIYETFIRFGTDPSCSPGAFHTLLSGGFAGVASWMLTMPLDVIKTRLQIDGTQGRYKNVVDCITKSYRSEGWSFLLRGMTSTLLRAFIMNSVCFYVVELILNVIDDDNASRPAKYISDQNPTIIPSNPQFQSYIYTKFNVDYLSRNNIISTQSRNIDNYQQLVVDRETAIINYDLLLSESNVAIDTRNDTYNDIQVYISKVDLSKKPIYYVLKHNFKNN